MEEYLDILDENGKRTGEIRLKEEAHQLGLFHPTVHIWFYTKRGEILMQKRASGKDTFPGFWDVSVAGHIHAGESIDEAALREVKEEIGIDIKADELQSIDIRKNVNIHPNGIKDCEFQHVFIAQLTQSLEELSKQEEEVDGLQLLTLEAFEHHYSHPDSEFNIVPADTSYYTFVKEKIRKIL